MISAVGAVGVFALSKATELVSAYVAHRRRRSAFIRALFAEIEFNTDELRVFTAQRRPKADLEAFFAGGADRRPHITDARHTIIYQRNIDLISFVDDGLVRKIVAFYGDLEKLKAQVDGLQLASFTSISAAGRVNTVAQIYETVERGANRGAAICALMRRRYRLLETPGEASQLDRIGSTHHGPPA